MLSYELVKELISEGINPVVAVVALRILAFYNSISENGPRKKPYEKNTMCQKHSVELVVVFPNVEKLLVKRHLNF